MEMSFFIGSPFLIIARGVVMVQRACVPNSLLIVFRATGGIVIASERFGGVRRITTARESQ